MWKKTLVQSCGRKSKICSIVTPRLAHHCHLSKTSKQFFPSFTRLQTRFSSASQKKKSENSPLEMASSFFMNCGHLVNYLIWLLGSSQNLRNIWACVYICVCDFVCVCVCVYICVCVWSMYVCVCAHVSLCIICTCVYVYVCTHVLWVTLWPTEWRD